MGLRRKILVLFTTIAVINGAVTLWLGLFPPIDKPFHIAIIASVVVVQVFLSYVGVDRLVFHPLRLLAEGAMAMASGRTAVLDVDRNDEIGQVANAVNHMAESLRSTMLHSDNLVRRAVTDAENALNDRMIADQLSNAGRVAVHMARNIATPLSAIDGLADGMEWAKVRNLRQLLGRIHRSIGEGIEESRHQPEIRAVGVCEPLRQAISLLVEKMQNSKIELSLFTEDKDGKSDPILVMADSDDLCHIFYNLIENAIESMPDGGKLAIKAERVYSWAVVEIVDTGIGMTMEEVAAAFDFFHTTKVSGHAYGLGLSLSRHVVLGYGGSLTLNSHKGEGTRTAVELPLVHNATTVRRTQRIVSPQ